MCIYTNFKSGKKTVFRYFLKPISNRWFSFKLIVSIFPLVKKHGLKYVPLQIYVHDIILSSIRKAYDK